MKTEQKLEIYRELFGSLPDVPEGKELVGVEFRPPLKGETYFHNTHPSWGLCFISSAETDEPVAIFQDAHRADGTPLSIDPLPEVEGYRVEYLGEVSEGKLKVGEKVLVFDNRLEPTTPARAWCECIMKGIYVETGLYYALLFKIAQPTTLADLVGEDGQKNFYLIQRDDSIFAGEVDTILGTLEVNSAELTHHFNKGRRWSHSPFTSWADAKEFIPETK